MAIQLSLGYPVADELKLFRTEKWAEYPHLEEAALDYLMEFEPAYIDVIIDRWERHTGKKWILRGKRRYLFQAFH